MNLNSNQKWMQRTSLFLAVVATGMVAPAWAQTSLPLHPEAEEPVPQAAPQSVDPEAAAAAAAAVEAVNTIAPEPSPQAVEALLGQSVHQVLPQLTEEGWLVTVQTPRSLQLENGETGLDVGFSPETGEIVEAALVNLRR